MKKQLDTDAVMNELKTGSAFFKQSESSPEDKFVPPTPVSISKLATSSPPVETQAVKTDYKIDDYVADNQSSKAVNQQASNMTILHFNDAEVEELREPAYQAQTFRLTNKEIEWAKDTAYRLSKEVKRGKVSQADILRISFKLFENMLAVNKAELMRILDRIK